MTEVELDKIEVYNELTKIEDRYLKAISIMRKHNFVIDNLEDRWQKLAFTLYTLIVEDSMTAKELREILRGE